MAACDLQWKPTKCGFFSRGSLPALVTHLEQRARSIDRAAAPGDLAFILQLQLVPRSDEGMRFLGGYLAHESSTAWAAERVAEHFRGLLPRLRDLHYCQQPGDGRGSRELQLAILRSCCVTRGVYLMRVTRPEVLDTALAMYDGEVRAALIRTLCLTGGELERDDILMQAALPVRLGGLGIVSLSRLAPAAFCGCLASLGKQIAHALGPHAQLLSDERLRTISAFRFHHQQLLSIHSDPSVQTSLSAGLAAPQLDLTTCSYSHAQRAFSRLVHAADSARLFATVASQLPIHLRAYTTGHIARLHDVQSYGAGAWLIPSWVGQDSRMGDRTFLMAVRLRLGVPLDFDSPDDRYAWRPLSSHCRPRHQRMLRALERALAHADLSPSHRMGDLARTLDGSTSCELDTACDALSGTGKLGIDVSVVSPACATALQNTPASRDEPLAAAKAQEAEKRRHYEHQMAADATLVPFVLQVFGGWGPSAESFLRDLLPRLRASVGSSTLFYSTWDDGDHADPGRDGAHAMFVQHSIGFAVQHGNADLLLAHLEERRAVTYGRRMRQM